MAADSQTLPIFKRERDRNPLGLAARPSPSPVRKWHLSLLARQNSFGSYSPREESAEPSPPGSQGTAVSAPLPPGLTGSWQAFGDIVFRNAMLTRMATFTSLGKNSLASLITHFNSG